MPDEWGRHYINTGIFIYQIKLNMKNIDKFLFKQKVSPRRPSFSKPMTRKEKIETLKEIGGSILVMGGLFLLLYLGLAWQEEDYLKSVEERNQNLINNSQDYQR